MPNHSKINDPRFWNRWHLSGAVPIVVRSVAIVLPNRVKMGFHQINSDISLPTRPDLMRSVLTQEQLVAIADEVGQDELVRIAAVTHGGETNPDYSALAEKEGHDLAVLRQAINTVTGKNRPWITGYASEFALGLMSCVGK